MGSNPFRASNESSVAVFSPDCRRGSSRVEKAQPRSHPFAPGTSLQRKLNRSRSDRSHAVQQRE
jgi:hypothetical protein